MCGQMAAILDLYLWPSSSALVLSWSSVPSPQVCATRLHSHDQPTDRIQVGEILLREVGRGLQEGRAQAHATPSRQTEGQSQRLMTWAGKTSPFIGHGVAPVLPDSRPARATFAFTQNPRRTRAVAEVGRPGRPGRRVWNPACPTTARITVPAWLPVLGDR